MCARPAQGTRAWMPARCCNQSAALARRRPRTGAPAAGRSCIVFATLPLHLPGRAQAQRGTSGVRHVAHFWIRLLARSSYEASSHLRRQACGDAWRHGPMQRTGAHRLVLHANSRVCGSPVTARHMVRSQIPAAVYVRLLPCVPLRHLIVRFMYRGGCNLCM